MDQDCLNCFTCHLQERAGGQDAVQLLPVTTAAGKSQVQVWLGSSQGWSLPVALTIGDPQVRFRS